MREGLSLLVSFDGGQMRDKWQFWTMRLAPAPELDAEEEATQNQRSCQNN